MIQILHLLDDFSMGGVTQALKVFEEPELASRAVSATMPIARDTRMAPKLGADIIVTHFPPSWARLPFFLSLRLRNPAAQLVHVEHSYTRGFEYHNVPNPARFRRLLRTAYLLFDTVICVSKAQLSWLNKSVGIPAQKCLCIYPWSGREDLLQLPPPKPGERSTLRLAAYGRFSDVKNYAALIDAIAAMGPAVELHLAGAGPDEAKLVERALMANNISIHGRIDNIGQFLSQADAVIAPSKWESFGLVATEARLAARPVIVADVDGLSEQVGGAGIAAPCRTPSDIIAAIEQFRTRDFAAMSRIARRDAARLRGQIVWGWLNLLKLDRRQARDRRKLRPTMISAGQ